MAVVLLLLPSDVVAAAAARAPARLRVRLAADRLAAMPNAPKPPRWPGLPPGPPPELRWCVSALELELWAWAMSKAWRKART